MQLMSSKIRPWRVRVLAWSFLFFVFVLMTTESPGAADGGAPPCPDPALGESPEDCPWAGVSRKFAQSGGKNFMETLQAESPRLAADIRSDAKLGKALLGLWGESINFDELAQGEIVPAAILTSLEEVFLGHPLGRTTTGQTPRRVTHAGVEHTYGYLFSNLRTSFGYKRARWVTGELERGFELPPGVMGPTPDQGSLLVNATWLAGRIAFREDPASLARLKPLESALSQAVHGVDPRRLSISRLEEFVKTSDGASAARLITLRTDFARFPTSPSDPARNSHWLIYSVEEKSADSPAVTKLITAFPVNTSFVERAADASTLGADQKIITRYNAWVEGVSGQEWRGERRFAPATGAVKTAGESRGQKSRSSRTHH